MKRVTISLSDENYATLKRMYSLNKMPMSKTIVGLLDTVMPVLDRLCDGMEKLKSADKSIVQGLRNSAEKNVEKTEKLLGDALGQFDMFIEDMEKFTGKSEEMGGTQPPPNNMGVNSEPENKEKNKNINKSKT